MNMEHLIVKVGSVGPLLVLVAGALTLLLADVVRDFVPRSLQIPRIFWNVAVCVSAWIVSWPYLGLGRLAGEIAPSGSAYFSGLVFADAFSFFFVTLIIFGLVFCLLLQDGQLKRLGCVDSLDIDVLMLLAAVGAITMVIAADLMILFIGFELMSLSVYALTGSARNERASAEGALKYFILGAFSSAFLLYGMALLYGSAGSLKLSELVVAAGEGNPIFYLGVILFILGFAFKMGASPFHFWVPDAYQGAPSSITTFMGVVVKAAAVGGFLRVMNTAFVGTAEHWTGTVWVISLLSMSVGNLMALRQTSVKRMLAYSSVAHAGYMLMGFLALGSQGAELGIRGATGGVESVMFYLVTYVLVTLISFGVVTAVSVGTDRQFEKDSIESFRGLGWSSPYLALVMTIGILSLAGIPPLVGFFSKLLLITAVVNAGFIWLPVAAVINSVIALGYYLRIIVAMYFGGETVSCKVRGFAIPGIKLVVGVAALLLLSMTFVIDPFIQLASLAR